MLLARQIRRGHVKKSLRRLAPELAPPQPREPASAMEADLRALRERLETFERLSPARVKRALSRRLPRRR
jgi:hypothetical protein